MQLGGHKHRESFGGKLHRKAAARTEEFRLDGGCIRVGDTQNHLTRHLDAEQPGGENKLFLLHHSQLELADIVGDLLKGVNRAIGIGNLPTES